MRLLLLGCLFTAVPALNPDEPVRDLEEPVGIDPIDTDAQVIYNKTYIEHESALEKDLFKDYLPLIRPVQNASDPMDIYLHWHVVHISINQKEQTLTIHGHLYMTWKDEKLGWDPESYNGIKITRSKKWQVWHPKLSVSNTASGVYSIFEISSQAHVLVQTIGAKAGAKVEMYPTFSIKASCAFDYSDFPEDYNSCTISVYAPEATDKIHLHVYGPHIPPTLMLGWGAQSDKKIVSDFEILSINTSVVYYRGGNYSASEPITDEDAATSWSMSRLTISFRRHSALFGVNIILPIFIIFSLIISSFFIVKVTHAFYSLLSTLLILFIFMEDLTNGVPLVVMGIPKSISLYGELMVLLVMALGAHLLFHSFGNVTNYGPPLFVTPYLEYIRPYAVGKADIGKGQSMSWKNAVPLIRPVAAFIFAVLFLGSYLIDKFVKLTQ